MKSKFIICVCVFLFCVLLSAHFIYLQIQMLGMNINYRAHRRLIVFSYMFMASYITILLLCDYFLIGVYDVNHTLSASLFLYALYLIQCLAFSSISTTFIFWLVSMWQRFDLLNKLLKRKFLHQYNRIDVMLSLFTNCPKSEHVIIQIGILHERLCDIIDVVNQCYSVQVLQSYSKTLLNFI